ncbi:hypothetical protein CHARACLAT_016174 [Characodon lateralis]|uniref:Translin-associated factor X-interacting protein 1 N-terminal domain-containing protein n=1 Tax=Characodon lateralis TaxID=208331 RepID=A0ABU7D7Y8_9TELE|nr:hypothetical protein [Characodon lateralis]
MNKGQNDPEKTEINSLVDTALCEDDRRFFQSLNEFIDEEKKYLQCPDEGADELRYIIYRSVFNKVIGRAAAYRRLLLAIKAEYDDTIRELKRREDEAAAASSGSNLQSLLSCQRRAAQITDRISVLQSQTAELQEEVRRQKSTTQSRLVPGLTVAQCEDPEFLQVLLEDLQTQREVLLDRKSQCVPVEVQSEHKSELQKAEHHRDHLRAQNHRLMTRCKRLKFVWDHLMSWEETGQKVPLEDLLGSTIQNIQMISSESLQNQDMDEDFCCIDAELSEHEEPTGVDESKLLSDHLDRFLELFEAAQYEAAALHAARSPGGILRNSNTMEMFEGVHGPLASTPPALLFFWALLVTTATGNRVSGDVSLQGVSCALQHGDMQLITHAVTQNKLTFTEKLGDTLSEHAQKNPGAADLCLALATMIYDGCRIHQKTALSMCRRGLIHSAAEFMKQQLSAEECMWVLSSSPSLSLLQLLTVSQRGQAAVLSVGGACASMLADPQQHRLALQLLDGFMSRGPDVLVDVILEERSSSVDVWDQVACLCSDLKRDDLSQAVRSVLLDQNGTGVRSPDLEGARLTEDIFL